MVLLLLFRRVVPRRLLLRVAVRVPRDGLVALLLRAVGVVLVGMSVVVVARRRAQGLRRQRLLRSSLV